jgi:sugar (pentulose or hexulose) kinase
VEWYIDNYVVKNNKSDDKYAVFNQAAASAPPGSEGLFIRFRPGSQPAAPEGASVACIARAVMEGTAFSLRLKMEELSELGITADRITMVGGPSESRIWTQIVADVTGLELLLINGQNAGAVGAATIAGIATGIFPDEAAAFQSVCDQSKRVIPDPTATRIYNDRFQDYREESQ